jgi:hypothetical protein
VDAFHERLARVALSVGSDLGFALAGGYAVQAHGFLTRPSEDVDLFTSSERTDFRDGVTAIKSAYEKNGIEVRVDVCSDHFARLWVTDTHSGQSGKVELATDIRSQAPVTMSIGPVVHVDDVAGGKMGALFTRAEARDFIDIYPDAEFSAYGLHGDQIRQMRERFADWRSELLQQPGPNCA